MKLQRLSSRQWCRRSAPAWYAQPWPAAQHSGDWSLAAAWLWCPLLFQILPWVPGTSHSCTAWGRACSQPYGSLIGSMHGRPAWLILRYTLHSTVLHVCRASSRGLKALAALLPVHCLWAPSSTPSRWTTSSTAT